MKEYQVKSCCGNMNREKVGDRKENQRQNLKKNFEVQYEDKMTYLNGGLFLMGTNDHEGFKEDREGPVREVQVSSFYIDTYTVTNQEFSHFVKETGYQTDAEKYGWSFVFYQFIDKNIKDSITQLQTTPWWFAVDNAYWYKPEGSASSLEERWDHPVVHISWNDANAFCSWAGKRLPTEAEWEYAARGDLNQKKYPWGNELRPDGKHMCNIWQGAFPTQNTVEDGYIGTAPAQSFLQNDYGLYSVSGNVWEWCENSFFPELPHHDNRAMRGGSYLCHDSYCNRYRLAARSSNTKDSSTGNLGFRCVKST